MRRAPAFAAICATVCAIAPVQAIDSERALSQYIRDRWSSENGYPGGPVYGLTQTADGFLWIAAEKGLVRFDGLSFQLLKPSGLTAETGPTVLGVVPAPDGSLWARLRGPALVRYRRGVFENILSQVVQPESVVTAMVRNRDNGILVASLGRGAISYRDGAFSTIAPASSLPATGFIISIAETDTGDIWLGTRDTGLLQVRGQEVRRIAAELPDPKVNCLLAGDHGEVWIGTDKGVVRWDGERVTTTGVPDRLRNLQALAMMRDRDGNLWLGTTRGLFRINQRGVTTFGDPGAAGVSRQDRSGGTVTALFEDRDGNVWLGTTRGVERLRDGAFTTYTVDEHLPSDGVGPIYVDPGGRTWFAPPSGGLYWLQDGEVGRVVEAGLGNDVVYSIAGSGADVWIGRQRGGLTRLRARDRSSGALHLTQADGLAQNNVFAVHVASDGAVWAGTLSGGVSRYKDGVFTTYTTATGLASNTVSSIVQRRDGTLWFGTPNGVSQFSRGGWRRYTVADGLPSNDINVLFEDSLGDVWIGTAAGLARVHAGNVQPLGHAPVLARATILGLGEDASGWLWVATAEGVFRAHREGLADPGPGDRPPVREFGIADGLLALEGVKRHRSVVADARGRIWLAMRRGLSMADPGRTEGRAVPALVHVEAVSADGSPIPMSGAVSIPPGVRRVAVSYAALSLAVPERVRFRYRLDGLDPEWSAPATERQAVFTNLKPGPYTFHVTASNGEGVWNGADAVLRFDVEPNVWQTAWFRLSVLAGCALLGWAAYRLRVRHVARQLSLRFEERLAERTRIAQELHDTLLQGFVSASMQLDVAADRLPADSPTRASLTRVLELMRRVIDEGRHAVRGLRSSTSAPHDLEQAFSGIRQELAITESAEYRVIVEGRARPMNPLIRDEVYRIGREAVVNAFRHSGARSIELELEYAPGDLRLLVRDDGRGIDPEVVRSGVDGHWGLAGMRERAKTIGAAFKVRSRAAAGTEVELTVPASVAFVEPASPSTRRRRASGRLRRRVPAASEKPS